MSYRFMRVLVMFDLPVLTNEDKRHYRSFRKTLMQNGFIMMQESVYTRMLLTQSHQKTVLDIIRRNKPPAGLVQVLTVTEKQFSKMEFILGTYNSDVIDSDQRLIIL